jgi:hypothetical protein
MLRRSRKPHKINGSVLGNLLPCSVWGCRSKSAKNNDPCVIRQFVEKNEGLRPHIRWTKTPDFVRVYRGISLLNSRWREIRACNDNACGESKDQNFHDSLLNPTSWLLLLTLRHQFTDT